MLVRDAELRREKYINMSSAARRPLVDNEKENGKKEIFKGGFVFFSLSLLRKVKCAIQKSSIIEGARIFSWKK